MYTKEYVIRHVWSRAPGQTCLSLSLSSVVSVARRPLLYSWLALWQRAKGTNVVSRNFRACAYVRCDARARKEGRVSTGLSSCSLQQWRSDLVGRVSTGLSVSLSLSRKHAKPPKRICSPPRPRAFSTTDDTRVYNTGDQRFKPFNARRLV